MGNKLTTSETNQESMDGQLQGPSNEGKTYVKGSPNFSLSLYRKIVERHPGNVLFSPFIVLAALTALKEGTNQNTTTEMKNAMTMEEKDPSQDINLTFLSFDLAFLSIEIGIGSYQENPETTLLTSNTIYLPERIKVEDSFVLLTSPHYTKHHPIVTLQTMKNGGDLNGYRNQINGQVNEATKSNVKDCIPEEFPVDGDQVVIVCAIYFKSDYATNFNASDTYEGLFYRNANDSISTNMMHMTAPLHFAKSSEFHCRIIKLNYACRKLSMFVILPDDIEGLVSLEEKLSAEALNSLMEAMSKEEVNVKVELPKFQLDFGVSMKEVLKSAGINDLFCGAAANLSGISNEEGLHVSDFYYKALLDFSQETTEVKESSLGLNLYHPFKADHPFMFFIYHEVSKLIIFVGRFSGPVAVRN